MKVLILDNYDSFTYNLAQYIGELGADPVVIRNDVMAPEEAAEMEPDRQSHPVERGPGVRIRKAPTDPSKRPPRPQFAVHRQTVDANPGRSAPEPTGGVRIRDHLRRVDERGDVSMDSAQLHGPSESRGAPCRRSGRS